MPEWVTTKDVMEIAGCNKSKAQKIIKAINTEFREKNIIVPNMRKVSKKTLLKRIGVLEEG